MNADLHRRKWLIKAGVGLTLLPLLLVSEEASAKTNAALRAQFKYQNTPKENMSCTSCLEFIPGKSEKDSGGCKILPGDDEISPDGYCIRWNSM